MSFRQLYAERGIAGTYQGTYANPHEPRIHAALLHVRDEWGLAFNDCIDIGSGSGEVARAVGPIDQTDPYTYKRYGGLPYGFEDASKLRHYSLAVCSYSLHLLERSRLPKFLYDLPADRLLILSPHKRPVINHWRWRLTCQSVIQRVHVRLFALTPAGPVV